MSDYTLTTNYGLKKPTIAADNDAWGGHWNENADAIDALIKTRIDGLAGVYLPLAGGTVTGALTVQGLLAGPVMATGSSASQQLSDRFSRRFIDARDYGVIPDGATDNTANLQRAVNDAQAQATTGNVRTVLLPPGVIVTNQIVISGPVAIQGISSSTTALHGISGMTVPVVVVQTAGAATTSGWPPDMVHLVNLRITSQDGKPGDPGVHGLQINAGVRSVRVSMRDVAVIGVSGNGINAPVQFQGHITAYDCTLWNNAGDGLQAHNCTDWHFYDGLIALNGNRGIALASCSQFTFIGTDIFSNAISNAFLTSAAGEVSGNHFFSQVMFDRGSQLGLNYDLRGTGGATFINCTFGACSLESPGTYSAVRISSAANNFATFVACNWPENFTNDATKPDKYALEFAGATQLAVVDGANHYAPGLLRTNASAQVMGVITAGGPYQINTTTGARVIATTQFTGFTVNNGTNNIAVIQGFAADNDTGVFQLRTGGTTVMAQLSASSGIAPNYINGDVYLGNGQTNAAPTSRALRGTDGVGTNIAGANLTIASGRGTGTGAGGNIVFRTAPGGSTGAGQNAEVTRATIDATGALKAVGSFAIWNAAAPAAKPAVTGSRGGNAALASALTALASYGFFVDSSTA